MLRLAKLLDFEHLCQRQSLAVRIEREFLSVEQLVVCGFTSWLIAKGFKGIASASRDRVEFRSDESFVLLEERKSRGNRKRPALPDRHNFALPSMKRQREEEAVVEIL